MNLSVNPHDVVKHWCVTQFDLQLDMAHELANYLNEFHHKDVVKRPEQCSFEI